MSVSELGYCRNCGASIRFIDMPSGKRMPVDSVCIWVHEREGGQILFTSEGRRISGVTDALESLKTTPAYRPHWASCERPEKKKKAATKQKCAPCGLQKPAAVEKPKPEPKPKARSEFEQMALFTVYDEREVLVSKYRRRKAEEEGA